jgi:hypothetical protein
VDWLVCEAWDWLTNAEGDLATMLDRELDRIRDVLLNGGGTHEGLRGTLASFAKKRAELRREAILEALSSMKE